MLFFASINWFSATWSSCWVYGTILYTSFPCQSCRTIVQLLAYLYLFFISMNHLFTSFCTVTVNKHFQFSFSLFWTVNQCPIWLQNNFWASQQVKRQCVHVWTSWYLKYLRCIEMGFKNQWKSSWRDRRNPGISFSKFHVGKWFLEIF